MTESGCTFSSPSHADPDASAQSNAHTWAQTPMALCSHTLKGHLENCVALTSSQARWLPAMIQASLVLGELLCEYWGAGGELNKARSISIFLNHSNGVRSRSPMRFGSFRTFLKCVHKQVIIKLYGKRTCLAVTKQMDCNKTYPNTRWAQPFSHHTGNGGLALVEDVRSARSHLGGGTAMPISPSLLSHLLIVFLSAESKDCSLPCHHNEQWKEYLCKIKSGDAGNRQWEMTCKCHRSWSLMELKRRWRKEVSTPSKWGWV